MVSVPAFVTATILALPFFGLSFIGFQQLVIHKEGSREYHRPWCDVVRDGKDVLALTLGQAEARGLKSHTACEKDPSAHVATPTGADAARPTGSAGRKPAPPVFVYVDGGKYYHREKCANGAGPLTRVALELAGKTRWPCPSCRPPLRKKTNAPAVPKRGGSARGPSEARPASAKATAVRRSFSEGGSRRARASGGGPPPPRLRRATPKRSEGEASRVLRRD